MNETFTREPIRGETPQENLRYHLQSLYTSLDNNDPIRNVRAKFWDSFLEHGFPERKHEAYQYVPLRQLYSSNFSNLCTPQVSLEPLAPRIYPECKHSVLVFINGLFYPSLSRTDGLPKSVVIAPLKQATKTYGSFLNNRWSKSLKEEKDSFVLLNGALHQEGTFIYIPPKTFIPTPIQVLNIIDTPNPLAIINPRLHVFAGTQSEATFVFSDTSPQGQSYWVNQLHDFVVEEAARIHYVSLNQPPSNSWHFDAIRVYLKRNSYFKSVAISTGCKTTRQDFRVSLLDEGAETYLYGLWNLSEARQAHTNVFIEHAAPNCRSSQLFKGVLNDASRSSFEGKIYVHPEAQKTDAFQLNNHLLLSDNAQANSKPNLEIFADDVKASHGSTVGQIDKEHLFYLQTRGLAEKESKQLLIQGFNREVIDLITIPSVHEAALKMINQ